MDRPGSFLLAINALITTMLGGTVAGSGDLRAS